MKKLILIIVIAFFGFNYVYAQGVDLTNTEFENLLAINDNEFEGSYEYVDASTSSNLFLEKVTIGAIAGLVQSTIVGDNADSFDCLTAYHFGVLVHMPVSDVFAVQPELLFARMGSKYKEEGYIEPIETGSRAEGELRGTYKLDYLQLPIMAQYFVIPGLSLEAGPQVSFLVSAKDEYEINGTSMTDDVKEFTKGIDFGINAGVGYKFDAGYHLRARYNLGLSEINDFPENTGESWKNSAFQFAVGYYF